MAIVAPKKEVKEHIGRAKSLFSKGETIKGIFELCEGLKKYIASLSKIIGADKMEIEDLFRDSLQYLSMMQEIQKFLDEPLVFKRGAERQIYGELVGLVRRIAETMQKGVDEEELRRQERQQMKEKLLSKLQDFLRAKDSIKAGGQLKKIMEELENEPGILTEVADTYYKAGMYNEAVDYATKAIAKNSKDMPAYRVAVNSYRCQKEHPKAIQLYKHALKIFGQHPNIYLNMGRVYFEMGSFDDAGKAAQAVLALEPDNQEAAALLRETQKGQAPSS